MSDSLDCFAYLVANVPLWIQKIEELEKKLQERYHEIARVPVPVSQKVRRTGSNESIRPGQPGTNGPNAMEITSAPQANDMAHPATTAQILSKRKRKTASLLTNVSTPNKYRSRSSIIVYYDSAVQEAFEQMVRNIGTGRNHIRKARLAARMEAFTGCNGGDIAVRLPTRGTRNGPNSGYDAMLVRGLRSARGAGPRPDYPAANGYRSSATDACELVDRALDKAQELCEKGAHQFLRDGECDEETTGVKETFKEVVKLSEKEFTRRKEVQKEKEKERIVERQRQQGQQNRESLHSHPSLMNPNGLTIEADDDDDDDEDEDDDEFDDPGTSSLPHFHARARVGSIK